jgi:hypothetical protein
VRRVLGVVLLSVLTMVPTLGYARTLDVASPPADLGQQLLLRFFGETSDARASLEAAYGNVRSESPLRNLALSVETAHPQTAAWDVVSVAPTFATADPVASDDTQLMDTAGRYDPAFAPARAAQYVASSTPAFPGQTDFVASPGGTSFISGEYRPDAPAPSATTTVAAVGSTSTATSESGRLAFSQSPSTSAWTSSATGGAAFGPVHVNTHFDSSQLTQQQSALTDGGYGAGAAVNVRALHRNLNFAVSSDYERLMRDDPSGSAAFSPSSKWQLPGGDVPLVVPNYADMSRISLGAALAVPVVNNLTLNLNVGSDRMLGAYGLPGVNNLDATDNSYGGGLTFAIPHSAGSLSISARQLHYQDNLLPSDTYTQTREDVNFTVKF